MREKGIRVYVQDSQGFLGPGTFARLYQPLTAIPGADSCFIAAQASRIGDIFERAGTIRWLHADRTSVGPGQKTRNNLSEIRTVRAGTAGSSSFTKMTAFVCVRCTLALLRFGLLRAARARVTFLCFLHTSKQGHRSKVSRSSSRNDKVVRGEEDCGSSPSPLRVLPEERASVLSRTLAPVS